MDKNQRSWIIGICIALILILLIFTFTVRGCSRQAPQSETITESTLSSMTESTRESALSETHSSESHSETEGTLLDSLNGGNALNKYLTEQDSIMMAMMEDMVIRTPSGSASLDFLKGMSAHHKAAVSMAESYLKYGGENEEMANLAKDIITAQKEELKQMDDLMKQYENQTEETKEDEEAYLKRYHEMLSSHSSHHISSSEVSDIDHAFAAGMTEHHQMAVSMAEDILEYTKHEKVRTLAQSIIDTQKKEIEQMESFLANNHSR